MGYTLKRTLVLMMLLAGLLAVGLAVTSTPSLHFGQAAFAGGDCEDDQDCGDSGGSPSSGVDTGGGGTAKPDDAGGLPVLPLAAGAVGVLGAGTLLLRRRATA